VLLTVKPMIETPTSSGTSWRRGSRHCLVPMSSARNTNELSVWRMKTSGNGEKVSMRCLVTAKFAPQHSTASSAAPSARLSELLSLASGPTLAGLARALDGETGLRASLFDASEAAGSDIEEEFDNVAILDLVGATFGAKLAPLPSFRQRPDF